MGGSIQLPTPGSVRLQRGWVSSVADPGQLGCRITTVPSSDIFTLLSDFIHVDQDLLTFAVLFWIAILIEVGAIALLGEKTVKAASNLLPSGDGKSQAPEHRVRQELSDLFQALTTNGATEPGDRVIPRDEAARKIGMTSHRAKQLLEKLCTAGIIKQDGRLFFLAVQKPHGAQQIQKATIRPRSNSV
jgi:hypothetical protein